MPRIVTRRSRRQVLSMGAGALGAALLAACGGLTEEQPPPSTPFPSIPLPASYPGANATPGGVLRLGALAGEQRTQALRRLTGAQLVAVDPRTAIVYADLAESVELPEPLTVVFTLRQGLRFHPDARGLSAALTSGDVAREFQARAAAGEHLFNEVVERVETPDQRTVILHLRGRFSQLFESLGGASTGAVRSVQRSPVSGEQLGSGPFVPFAGEAGQTIVGHEPDQGSERYRTRRPHDCARHENGIQDVGIGKDERTACCYGVVPRARRWLRGRACLRAIGSS